MEKVQIPLKRLEIWEELKNDELDFALSKVMPFLKFPLSSVEQDEVYKNLKNLGKTITSRYRSVGHRKTRFLTKFQTYLDIKLSFRKELMVPDPSTSALQLTSRKNIPFHQRGVGSRRNIMKEIEPRLPYDPIPVLATIAKVEKRKGNKDLAAILSEAATSPESPTKMRWFIEKGEDFLRKEPVTPTEALSVLLKGKCTRKQYDLFRNLLKQKGYGEVLPSYSKVSQAKKTNHPDGIPPSTECSTEVGLNSTDLC